MKKRISKRSTPKPDVALPGGTLGRIVGYGQKVYGLLGLVGLIRDSRKQARISSATVVLSYILLFVANLGSLNALEQYQARGAWGQWLGGSLPSADTMGRVAAVLAPDGIREALGRMHGKRKRNKGLRRGMSGWRFLILDGHEGVSSYKRRWKGCLDRIVHFAKGDRTQYYWRYVMAYVTNGRDRVLLDAEPQLPEEGEAACAIRLLERVCARYSRAFDVVCGDNLYMDPALWKYVRSKKKHMIAVLKNENRDLTKDARSLSSDAAKIAIDDKNVKRLCWDIEGCNTWPQCGEAARVVRSLETTTCRPQKDRKSATPEKTTVSEWMWVTSLPQFMATTETIVRAGHGRWDIENYGFNELVSVWHADHAYKYDANALLTCLLLLFIAYNLFRAWWDGNLKPQRRKETTEKYWHDLIKAEFCLQFAPRARSA